MAWTFFELWKFVQDMDSSNHLGLIIAPDQETNGDDLGIYFRSSAKQNGMLSILIRIALHFRDKIW